MNDEAKKSLPLYLSKLEDEAISIIREAYAQFDNPVILYSVGKDSSVLTWLARKAFYPGKVNIPLMHIDTEYKFNEMYEFRDKYVKEFDFKLIVSGKNDKGLHPDKDTVDKCCAILKTGALLNALKENEFDVAIGGARRDEEKSRAKERVFSFRNKFGEWDSKAQKPEIWKHLNGKIDSGETVRAFPLSNWTEEDIWTYIYYENIPVVPLYFAKERKVESKNGILIPTEDGDLTVKCRFRSLGCSPCTGAVKSDAATIEDIIEELQTSRNSERQNRVIDQTSDSSMEDKKKSGYF